VNNHKTKEMLIGPIVKDPPLYVTLCGTLVERVTTFKLLGVHIVNNLKWTQHVDAISSKVASRLYEAAQTEDLLFLHHIYTSSLKICPPSLAFESNCCVATAEGDENYLPIKRPYVIGYFC